MYLYNKSLNQKNLIFISKIDQVQVFFPKSIFYIVKHQKSAQFTVFTMFLNVSTSELPLWLLKMTGMVST